MNIEKNFNFIKNSIEKFIGNIVFNSSQNYIKHIIWYSVKELILDYNWIIINNFVCCEIIKELENEY